MKRVAVFNDTRLDQDHYGCGLVMRNLFACMEKHDMCSVFELPYNIDWRACLETLPKLGEIDAVLINGEGTMHHASSRPRARALSELGRYVKDNYQIPAFIINATFHSNDAQFYEDLKYFDNIFVRDTASCDEALSHGVAAQVVPDLSIAHANATKKVSRSGTGVTDSVVESDYRALQAFARNNHMDFFSMSDRSERHSIRKFIRHPKKLKFAFLDALRPESPRFTSPEKFVDWVASKKLIITGRFHTVTICVATNTPFLYLESNTPKITSLVEDIGLDKHRRIDRDFLDQNNIDANNYSFSAVELAALTSYLNNSQRAFENMFSIIAKTISTNDGDK